MHQRALTRRLTIAPRRLRAAVWTVFALFVVWACAVLPGWDLTASFVAGRLVASGQGNAVYRLVLHTPLSHLNPAWLDAARQGGIADGVVTPYVQTPLWAWLLAPVAAHTDFATFKTGFAGLIALAAIGMVHTAARLWAPRLAGAFWQAALLLALAVSVPFVQALALGQTHVIFLYLTILAASLCLSGQPVAAGLLLALAASVKITPAWLALGWLVAGRWRASASFAAGSAALALATLAVCGQDVTAEYLRHLAAYSHTVTLAFNNDSLATLLLQNRLTGITAFRPAPMELPLWASLLSIASIALVAVGGGWVDRRHAHAPAGQVGAVMTIVAATAFTPLAWNHYFIVLILPAMVFLQTWLDGGGRGWAGLAACILLLVTWPVAFTPGAALSAVARRSEFWAAIACIAGLAAAAVSRARRPAACRMPHPAAQPSFGGAASLH